MHTIMRVGLIWSVESLKSTKSSVFLSKRSFFSRLPSELISMIDFPGSPACWPSDWGTRYFQEAGQCHSGCREGIWAPNVCQFWYPWCLVGGPFTFLGVIICRMGLIAPPIISVINCEHLLGKACKVLWRWDCCMRAVLLSHLTLDYIPPKTSPQGLMYSLHFNGWFLW